MKHSAGVESPRTNDGVDNNTYELQKRRRTGRQVRSAIMIIGSILLALMSYATLHKNFELSQEDHYLSSFSPPRRLEVLDNNYVDNTKNDVKVVSINRNGNRNSNRNISDHDMTIERKLGQLDQSPPFYFAGCLVVRDDNVILPEWLAFHYTALPLRRLILATDPFDRVSPKQIVKMYRKIGLNITLWKLKVADDPEERHLIRQLRFYKRCMRKLKTEGWTWTVMIDSDEFIVPNVYHETEREHCKTISSDSDRFLCDQRDRFWRSEREKLPKLGGPQDNTTIAHIIKGQPTINTTSQFTDFACVHLPRALYGPMKSRKEELYANVPDGFDPMKFRTLRDRYHENWITNLNHGKSIVDVSRYDGQQMPKGPHRILGDQCVSYTSRNQSHPPLFRVQHYTGTENEFLFRLGHDRRSLKHFLQRTNFTPVGGPDDDYRGWLNKFIQILGNQERVYEVTEGLQLWATKRYKKLENILSPKEMSIK